MNLMELYGSRYRVKVDESFSMENDSESKKDKWRYYEIRGRHGVVFPYGWDKPAVTFTSNIVANRATEGKKDWLPIQLGEDEQTWIIPKGALNEVLEAIQPRRKRQVTEEMREKGRLLAQKHGFKPSKDVTQGQQTGVKGT